MINHNILDKISNKYVADRVREAIKQEEDKTYAYIIFTMDSNGYDQAFSMIPQIIKAESKKELYVKIFNREIASLLGLFIMKNYHNSRIKKYLDTKIVSRIDSDFSDFNDGKDYSDSDYFGDYYHRNEEYYDKNWREIIKNDQEYVEDIIYQYMNGLRNNIGDEYVLWIGH